MATGKRVEDVEKKFSSLREDYLEQKITETEFRTRLKELRINDNEGRCWTIGARTGNWYYFDGKNWIESQPPSIQEGKAICIHCGFENDLENEECSMCGVYMTESEEPFEKTKIPLETPTEELQPFAAPRIEKNGPKNASEFEEPQISTEMIEKTEAEDEDPRGEEFAFHSINPISFLLFWGIIGLFVGIILGVLAGTTDYLSGIVDKFPGFLLAVRGQLLKGILYGLLGGIFGFAVLAGFGAIKALFINVILYFSGGVRIRIKRVNTSLDKPDEKI